MVQSGEKIESKLANCMPLRDIPAGVPIHNIELQVGQGGILVRSAGNAARILAKEANYANVVLPSGEVRKIFHLCRATIGRISNTDHMNISLGKAGRKRWKGRRPHVRGTAMNPVAHLWVVEKVEAMEVVILARQLESWLKVVEQGKKVLIAINILLEKGIKNSIINIVFYIGWIING